MDLYLVVALKLTYYNTAAMCLTKVMSENVRIDTIYLDFAKAFDKVNHDILMKKSDNKSQDKRKNSHVDPKLLEEQKI